ncbi:hypothetical protein GGI07_005483 [Coemansia sp. Benny D115]|nr:hypothetical protein GGI07_005483 [Coemansia sp. Benny D115]
MTTLTRRQRYWQRSVSMLGACLATTTAGTVYLFSTYGPALSKQLHLTSTQANVVAISANYGLLLSGPFFGWAADTLGPRILSTFAALGSFSAFTALAYTYDGKLPLPHWLVLSGYMVLIGISCQAVNMSAITVTTRNFKSNRGAAVSLCIAFFGLSPFVLSHVNSVFFAKRNGGRPDVSGYLRFLSVLGLVTSLLAAISLSVVGFGPSRHRRDDIPDGFIADAAACDESAEEEEESVVAADEESALRPEDQRQYGAVSAAAKSSSAAADGSEASSMADGGSGPSSVSGGGTSTVASPPLPSTAAATTAAGGMPVPGRSTVNGLDYDTARDMGGMAYICDPEAQLLALVLFLCAGIGVFYNNNVGTIVSALYYSSAETPDAGTAQRLINYHVSAVSLGSFLGRLSIGPIGDMCKSTFGLARSGILVVVVFCMVMSQVVVGLANTLSALLVGSMLTGLSYGLLFGFVPLLVSVWFGTRHFGSNWGLTSVFIGFSGQMLGAFFGYTYDANVPDQDPAKCPNGSCYKDAFVLSVAVALLGLVVAVILARKRGERRRENRRFSDKEKVLTIPNALTMARIVSSPYIGYLIVQQQYEAALAGCVIFGLTDALDGWIARRYNMQSFVGSIIDPAADKILMTTLTVALGHVGLMPMWLAAVIIGRDVALSLAAFVVRWATLPGPKTLRRYFDLSVVSVEVRPTMISKCNTALQLLLMGVTLAAPLAGVPSDALALVGLQWLVGATTVASGLGYLVSRDAVHRLTKAEVAKRLPKAPVLPAKIKNMKK